MTRREDLRYVTIALVSTSALLLTILAVTHTSIGMQAVVALTGLYLAIGVGVMVLGVLVTSPAPDPMKTER